MLLEAPAILSRYPAGSVVPQEGPGAPDDQPTWVVKREVLVDLCRDLRDGEATRFDMLLDLCGVDYPEREERFEAVYHLYSVPRGERLRLKVPVTASDPKIPSVVPVWRAADWFEREAWDMFGLVFEGHPNLRRLLTHDGFQGHALRKDYDPARRWILTEDKIYMPKLEAPPGRTDSMFERTTINIGPRTRPCTAPSAWWRCSTARRSSPPRWRSATSTAAWRRCRRRTPGSR